MGDSAVTIPLILIGLVLLVVAIWLITRLGQSTTVVGDGAPKTDVLDEGAKPAQRNQALIDSAPAVEKGLPEQVADTPTPLAAAEPTPAPAPAPAPVPPAAPVPTPSPAPKPVEDTPAPLASSSGSSGEEAGDDLSQIKGVGPKLVTLLAENGVTTFAQIAAWSESDIAAIDAKLGRFKGRITRDQWVEQAKLLISGDKDAYAQKFGQNG